jgi:sodium-dependent phosphate cotransporter
MPETAISTVPPPKPPQPQSRQETAIRLSQALVLLFVFLVGIHLLGSGFKGLGKGVLEDFFHATENPFVGLAVGILGTTLVQSSSVTTSMIVAMVAAPSNPLPIANAVPMIMGANIGTTVTNTIVSLGHIGRPVEFKRAFAAATCHDFFNFIAVGVFLPLELTTGFLTKASLAFVNAVGVGGGGHLPNPIKTATKAVGEPVEHALMAIGSSKQAGAILIIFVSALVIFLSLFAIVKVLRSLAASRIQGMMSKSLDASPYLGILVGIIITVMVQSSSITTSVLVPLAGAGIITLRQVFPITLGANIGTTVTSILASMAAPQETAHLALQIAAVHFLFNLFGTIMIFPLHTTRQIPLRLAEWLSAVAVKSRLTALAYVVILFYGLPAGLVFVSRSF